MGKYSPLGAFRALKRFAQSQTGSSPATELRAASTAGAPVLPEYLTKQQPQTVCVLLAAYLGGSAVLPDDFDTVPKTSAGLKGHVRPDGGVYLGAFETSGAPDSMVLVYGDPMMSPEQAAAASMRFRRELQAMQAMYDEHKALGPFAGKRPTEEM